MKNIIRTISKHPYFWLKQLVAVLYTVGISLFLIREYNDNSAEISTAIGTVFGLCIAAIMIAVGIALFAVDTKGWHQLSKRHPINASAFDEGDYEE